MVLQQTQVSREKELLLGPCSRRLGNCAGTTACPAAGSGEAQIWESCRHHRQELALGSSALARQCVCVRLSGEKCWCLENVAAEVR